MQVYVLALLSQGRGYPLWKPKSDSPHLPEEYRRRGVHIGDVGYLNDFGGFEFVFNVCYPADHPINAGGVPPDFEVLEIEPTRISESQHEYKAGSIVASECSYFSQAPLPSDGKSLPM